MCGINGFAGFEDKKLIKGMNSLLRHRGPDEKGVYTDKNVSLGCARLNILDFEGSKQPMSNEQGDIQLVFNGEIYNYLELRKLLESRGHNFKSRGDTEVIVHAYEEAEHVRPRQTQ